jgi:L-alanine-DL-glutamate epimerase-like enolase superfamily enzyme
MPDMAVPIVEAWVERAQVRMARAVGPYVTGDLRDVVRVTLVDADGHVGVGEACPWPGLHAMDIDALVMELRAGVEGLCARDAVSGTNENLHTLAHDVERRNATPLVAWTLFAADVERRAAEMGKPLAHVLGGESAPIRTAALVVRDEPLDETSDWLSRVRTVKVKIAHADDDARVRAVHALAPEAQIRIDANGALSLQGACALAVRLSDLPIAFYEEPVAQSALAAFVDAGHPLALDESLRTLDDDRVRALRPSALVVKPSVLGPVRTLALVTAARDGHGPAPLIISSSFETRRARAFLAALHAVVSPHVCAGLGTGRFLDEPALEERAGVIVAERAAPHA